MKEKIWIMIESKLNLKDVKETSTYLRLYFQMEHIFNIQHLHTFVFL